MMGWWLLFWGFDGERRGEVGRGGERKGENGRGWRENWDGMEWVSRLRYEVWR